MAFNQLLWSLYGKVNHELSKEKDVAPYNLYPGSAQKYMEKFQKIIEQYETLKEFVDLSSGHCKPSVFKGKSESLYLEAFCNGVSTVLQDMNHTFLAIEESFLSESSNSMLEILNHFEYIHTFLPTLNSALKQLKEGKFHGCTILDLCENLVQCGLDVKNVFTKIQQHCLKQFYKQTKLWIMQTVLYDPYDEFFICLTEELNESLESCTSASVVESALSCSSSRPGSPKYKVNPYNLPNIIPLTVAVKIVFIGEALAICRRNDIKSKSDEGILSFCGISEQNFVSQLSEIEKKEQFSLKDFSSLIDDLWIGINKYIRQVSDEIGNVNEQLILMWEIYLLGRGELFQEFLLKGSSILNSDVTLVDSRTLNKVFKDAVYNVYLSEGAELTEQFFFKLPHKTALRQGTTAWSNLELKFKNKWPLDYLFTPAIISSYNRLFKFLLRLKKAHIDITHWKNISLTRKHSVQMELIQVRMHLMSVVVNLQNYCFTNVIANEMKIFLDSVQNATMFTDIQKALSLFLINLSSRLFLPDIGLNATSIFDKTITSVDSVYKCFRYIFTLCNSFSRLYDKDDEYVSKTLKSLKSKLETVLKNLFSLLEKIEQTNYYSGNSTVHMSSLIMFLDYNGFFKNKFEILNSF